MGYVLAVLFMFIHLLFHSSNSHPLCTNLKAPFTTNQALSFCQYNGSVCCNSTDDMELRNQFEAMKVSDAGCASLLKATLCSRCDQFSAELYQVESVPRVVPILCNSTKTANSTQSPQASINFCSKIWDECYNVSITSSPFKSQAEGGILINSTAKLTDTWPSKYSFCVEFGGSSDDGSVCFAGEAVVLNSTEDTGGSPSGICLEKIGNGSYINMAPHPDGSNRVFLSNQAGKIWLATIPKEGSGEMLGINELNPFLDLTNEVHFDAEFGMLGIAFHSNFQQNGRFFVSFNCDKVKWPQCSGRCSCNSDVGCNPSELGTDDGAEPCQYHSVIGEFTANETASQKTSSVNAQPWEVRRIFTMGLPFNSHHGGQILFGPADGYLYFMMGDGGNVGDPYNFSQNKKSLLGKIMRLDIDTLPSAKNISEQSLWGNYSIPVDNPFSEDKNLLPEIWSLGFRNPWRCSFDEERPSYFLCADVGQDHYEEVDIVTKGGNYGWRVYEGSSLYNASTSRGGDNSTSLINSIFPVMGYNHSNVNKAEGSASIIGGYFYRSTTDPCLYGRYLYADLYAGVIWAGTETPKSSGNFTSTRLPVSCARESSISCNYIEPGSTSSHSLGFIFSFGQDNAKDVYILASSGVYRIVRPSRCNYSCSKEKNVPEASSPELAPPPSRSGCHRLNVGRPHLLAVLLLLLQLYVVYNYRVDFWRLMIA